MKMGMWAPFSLLCQVSVSYFTIYFFDFSESMCFAIGIFITIHINYFVAAKYIFKKIISLQSYLFFFGTSGVTRFIDVFIFQLVNYGLLYEYRVLLCSGIGVIIRFCLYELLVFNRLVDDANKI